MSRKTPIRILDNLFVADAGISILSALQLYAAVRNLPTYGFNKFCWNASCHECIVRFCVDASCVDDGCDRDFACQNEITPNMQIKSLPAVLKWGQKLKVDA